MADIPDYRLFYVRKYAEIRKNILDSHSTTDRPIYDKIKEILDKVRDTFIPPSVDEIIRTNYITEYNRYISHIGYIKLCIQII